MSSSIARSFPSRLTELASVPGGVLREHGSGFVLFTAGIGAALAASLLDVFGPGGILPHPFPLSDRPFLLGLAVVLLVVAAGLGVAALRRRRGGTLVGLYGDGIQRATPLVALPFVLVLRAPLERAHAGVVLAIAAMAGALTTYSAYAFFSERGPARGRMAAYGARIALGLLVVAYSVAASYIAITNHININTGRSDLGFYLSIFRESSQGHPLGCSLCGGGSHLTGHFDPILVLLSPLFLLYPFAETLLVLQSVWLASGAIPVYLLARRKLSHRGAALALAAAYLAYPALHGVNFFDFHSIALCIPPFLFLLYYLDQGNKLGYYATLGLLLLVREDVSIALVFVGLYAIFSKQAARTRMGWVTIAAAVVYFMTVKVVFMHRIDPLNTASGASGGYAYFYEAMIPAKRSTAALIGTLVSNPAFVLAQVFTEEKIDFVLKLLVPLFFLPLAARGRMLLAYGAALTLLASREFLFSIHFQYTSVIIPFIFALSVFALGRVSSGEVPLGRVSGPRLARALAFGMLMTTVICSIKFGGLVPNASFTGGFRALKRESDPGNRELAAWLKKIALSLPRGARVAGNSRLITHLGPVSYLALLDDRMKADYVVINVVSRPFGPRILREAAAGDLTLMATLGHVRLYKAHYKSPSASGGGEAGE